MAKAPHRQKTIRLFKRYAAMAMLCTHSANAQNLFNMGEGLTSIELQIIRHPGNPGFACNPQVSNGSVSYYYQIARHEITNAQYAAFLNAVAKYDPYSLYEPLLSAKNGGIIRSGISGDYVYSVVAGRGDYPVLGISFRSAMRLCNWLHNGQPQGGGTESGAYNGISDGISETRAAGARYFLPTHNEWNKAAYYQPYELGGDVNGYWLYPTSSNSIPEPGVDENYDGVVGGPSPVGTFPPNTNYNRLYDLGGNVAEWIENADILPNGNGYRMRRGSAWPAPLGVGTGPTDFMMRLDFPAISVSATATRLGVRIAAAFCVGDIADDFGFTAVDGGGPDGVVDFGDFVALLGLIGPCDGGTPGCLGDIADDFGFTAVDGGGPDGVVDFGDFVALLGLIGPCP